VAGSAIIQNEIPYLPNVGCLCGSASKFFKTKFRPMVKRLDLNISTEFT
jgi:hypothetical protein